MLLAGFDDRNAQMRIALEQARGHRAARCTAADHQHIVALGRADGAGRLRAR